MVPTIRHTIFIESNLHASTLVRLTSGRLALFYLITKIAYSAPNRRMADTLCAGLVC